jgi:hypothetical protein
MLVLFMSQQTPMLASRAREAQGMLQLLKPTLAALQGVLNKVWQRISRCMLAGST